MNAMVKEALKTDRIMGKLAGQFEVNPLPVTKDIYLDMLENIVSQQLSGKVAAVIFNRFIELFPNRYPEPELLIRVDDAALREVGLSRAKANYVKALAEFKMQQNLEVDQVQRLSDQEVIKLLTRVRGVGVWTAQMLLIFSLGRNDVFPVDDLAIRQGMAEFYNLHAKGKELSLELVQIAEKWAPYRTWGTRLIWAYVNSRKKNAARL